MVIDSNTDPWTTLAFVSFFLLPIGLGLWAVSSFMLAVARSSSSRRADRIVLRVQKKLLGGRYLVGRGWTEEKRAFVVILAYSMRTILCLALIGALWRVVSNFWRLAQS